MLKMMLLMECSNLVNPLATKAFLVWNQFHLSLIKVKPLKKYNHIWVFHTSSNHNNNEKIKCLFLWRFSNYKLSQQLISNHSFEYIIILCTPDTVNPHLVRKIAQKIFRTKWIRTKWGSYVVNSTTWGFRTKWIFGLWNRTITITITEDSALFKFL